MISRTQVLEQLVSKLQQLPFVYAMMEGGAAAFDRVDEWSDIDLGVMADDDKGTEVFAAIDAALAELSPIEIRYEIPQPTWHGQEQIFYRLQNASKFMLVDLCLMKRSQAGGNSATEIHGHSDIHFDKANLLQVGPMSVEDRLDYAKAMQQQLPLTRQKFDLFQILVLKELHRGNWIEAQSFFQSFTIRPLVEVLRMRYCPERYNFATRYVYYDLPADIIQQLEELLFVGSPAQLWSRHKTAVQLFEQNSEWLVKEGIPFS